MHEMIIKMELLNSLSPDAYGIANLETQQICDYLARKCFDSQEMWKALHAPTSFGVDFFLTDVIRQYKGTLIDDKAGVRRVWQDCK